MSPVAISLKFALTAEDRMVVPGTNVLTIVKVLEPLKGIGASYHVSRILAELCSRVLRDVLLDAVISLILLRRLTKRPCEPSSRIWSARG